MGKWYDTGLQDAKDGFCDPPWQKGHRDHTAYMEGHDDGEAAKERAYHASLPSRIYRFDYDSMSGTGIIVRLSDDKTSLRFTGADAERLADASAAELEDIADAEDFD